MPRLSGNGRNLTHLRRHLRTGMCRRRVSRPEMSIRLGRRARTRFSLHGVFLPEMPPPASPRNSIEARTLIAVEY